MHAILLAAGLGTRLRPITLKIPKCLIKLKNKPLLEIWIKNLIKAKIKRILINTHYLSDHVKAFVQSSEYKNFITLTHEPELLGTAGTLIHNLDFYKGDDVMLIHADNYCEEDLEKLIQAHKNRPNNCIMTMMTFRTKNPSSCGIVDLDKNNVVTLMHEKEKSIKSNLANCAVYILSKNFLEHTMLSKNIKDFSKEVIPKCYGKIFTFETKKIFEDIGTNQTYSQLKQILK